jgi:hypothetical protein
MDCFKHIFSQNSYQIGHYCTYTGPHLPILLPMWPASQKELPTPAIGEGRTYMLFPLKNLSFTLSTYSILTMSWGNPKKQKQVLNESESKIR